ncbi:uncharacterized protein ACA1_145730 [Acanthamoeba castellanii str. Neff]|uniref:PH domain-containing protein n=1 Tax=Acanthamoeba castellanii (strain ATCC 30010 / Neff) TaxID=1257118 RepID=L8GCJ8_ACACF|nr:uncharacterized protein ACA1_145730 [Acanthamoeba castellanii str. Neff]ELR10920.1 hypothetical protein ACA1_145730 [Acanthamoeba castellanii str. Neff]
MFGEILKTGWLSRKSKKSGEWREWWWVLRPGVISYQKNEQAANEPLGMINLEGAKLKRTGLEEGKKVGCIQVSTGEKEYFILAKGERLLTEWIVALEKAAQPRPTGNQLIRTTSKTDTSSRLNQPSRPGSSIAPVSPGAVRSMNATHTLSGSAIPTVHNQNNTNNSHNNNSSSSFTAVGNNSGGDATSSSAADDKQRRERDREEREKRERREREERRDKEARERREKREREERERKEREEKEKAEREEREERKAKA